MDLKDLGWRYYKGTVKSNHSISDSFINIKYNMRKDLFFPLQFMNLWPFILRLIIQKKCNFFLNGIHALLKYLGCRFCFGEH